MNSPQIELQTLCLRAVCADMWKVVTELSIWTFHVPL